MDNSKNEINMIKKTSSNENGVIESISEWPQVVVEDGQESKIRKYLILLDVERLTAKDGNHENNLVNDTCTTELAEHHNVYVERTEMLAKMLLWQNGGDEKEGSSVQKMI